MLSSLITTLALLPLALVSASGWRPTVHHVTVGGLDSDKQPVFRYHPEHVIAHVGDIVRFTFQVKNHTVTQSTFDAPCTPLYGGNDSGFKFVEPSATDNFPTHEYHVTHTTPIWFHCRQGDHCSRGMVFAINPHNHFHQFLRNAQATAGPKTHTVIVGGEKGNIYQPPYVHAKKGDTILFEFRQKNHTVTQSSFDAPCSKLHGGFDSDFKPVAPERVAPFDTWPYVVQDDSKPIWAYCRQTGHCKGGMVFAINPADKFLAFESKAKAS